jgi:hypothetical protein
MKVILTLSSDIYFLPFLLFLSAQLSAMPLLFHACFASAVLSPDLLRLCLAVLLFAFALRFHALPLHLESSHHFAFAIRGASMPLQ